MGPSPVVRGGDSATNGDVTNSATSCDVANGEKVYLGADPEAFVAMSQDVIHLRGTNSTCSSNKTDAIAAILDAISLTTRSQEITNII